MSRNGTMVDTIAFAYIIYYIYIARLRNFFSDNSFCAVGVTVTAYKLDTTCRPTFFLIRPISCLNVLSLLCADSFFMFLFAKL